MAELTLCNEERAIRTAAGWLNQTASGGASSVEIRNYKPPQHSHVNVYGSSGQGSPADSRSKFMSQSLL